MNRKTPIIPKIMRKNKLHIWKSFTVVDLCATIAFAIIGVLTGWGLSMLSTLARIIIGVIVFLMLEALLLPVKTWDVRLYNKIWDAFKFLASKKHYVYMPTEKGKKNDETIVKISDKSEKHLKEKNNNKSNSKAQRKPSKKGNK